MKVKYKSGREVELTAHRHMTDPDHPKPILFEYPHGAGMSFEELTLEEAKELRDELNSAIGKVEEARSSGK